MQPTRRFFLASAAVAGAGLGQSPVTRFVRYRRGATVACGILDGGVTQRISGNLFGARQPTGERLKLSEVRLLCPCEPSKILAVGLNYKSHIGDRPAPSRPEICFKPVSALLPPEEPIMIPPGANNVHYEGELVLVIGKQLRRATKTVHVFPNGAITSLANRSMGYSRYVFDLGVAYKEDTDRVIEAVRAVAEEVGNEPEYASLILEPVEVMGVERFDESAVVVRARIKTLPGKQFIVGREMNRRLKLKFDEMQIEIPFPHTSLYFGEASKPVEVRLSGIAREELEQVARKLLAEGQDPNQPPAGR